MQFVKIRIISRIRKIFSVWIFVQIGFVFSANPGDIVITEFFYKSAGNNYEYIELYNTTDSTIDLQGWEIDIVDNLSPYTIDETFKIDSDSLGVLVSFAGAFQDSTEQTYGSKNDSTYFFNNCASIIYNCNFRRDDIYWLGFSGLSDESGEIKLLDSDSNLIDEIIYNSADSGWSQIFGSANIGKSVEFILDPDTLKINGSNSLKYAHILNDDGLNWRSSHHESEWLWNAPINENGSPLIANFITPSIKIAASPTYGTSCDTLNSKTVCFPPSDGIPGGYAAIQLKGSAINVDSIYVTLDFLYWQIDSSNVPVQDTIITNSPIWYPSGLHIDTSTQTIIYKVPLFTRDRDGFMGKTGTTTIEIEQEFNYPPVVDSINGLVGGTIEIFDDDSLLLYGFVTDTELCNSSIISCTHDDLFYPNPYFGYLGSTFGSNESYDNSSPFLWISNSENLDNLDTIFSLETVFRPDSIISLGDISANNNPDTLEFQLKATDPFGESDSQIVKIIVHNKNQKPEISLNLENINGIYLIAGYSNKFIVNGGQIELYEFDASGVYINTTIIAQITDVDNDLNFTIIPLGTNCNSGFENNYCVSGTTIKTNHEFSLNDSLKIPFMVDDGVSSPIDGFASESESDIVYLVINKGNIKNVTHIVSFDDSIISLDEHFFHLPEDSTLTSEISFNINFKLDGNPHEVNWDSLQWSFHKLDSENEQRIFANKTDDGFKIDSLSNNFNGETGLKVFVTDNDNTAASLSDSIIINIPIFIDQRNDTLKHFNLYHDIKSYSINVSTIDTVREVRYFRLAQFSSDNNASNPTPKKLRFEWERNDYLDIDTNTDLNKDTELNIFYRLELIDTLTNVVSILKDSLQHNNFLEFENIWAEIDSLGDEFPFYYDSLGYGPQLEYDTIDINGLSTYRWRVVATNYWQDDLDEDPPVGISQEWNMTDFKIDLLQPEVTNLYIMLNEMYAGFYDLLWSSTEAFLTDSTFLSIKEETNQFSAISMLNPRRITDNLFHFTGIIPTDLTSAIIAFDLHIRDNAMNSGIRQDTVSYIKVSPDTASLLISPSNNVTISLQKNSVSEPVHIIITEENSNIASRESNTELYQLTPTIHFYPNELILNKQGSIYFDISDYLSSKYEPWQLTIFEINDTESISLTTNISEGMLTASIDKLGDYAVFVNTAIEKPLPTKFELKMNYPNPFNPSTTIPIELPEESFVEVAIYNILGEKITVLSKGVKSSGYHNILWNGKNQFGKPVSSGIYFVSVHLGQKIYHQKMMLLK